MKTQKSPFRPPLSASSPQEWVVGGRNGGRCFVSMRSHPHERQDAHSASCPVAFLPPPASPFESRHHQDEQTCPLPPPRKSMTNRRERGGVSTWVAATTRRPQHLCYPVQLTVLHRNRRLQDSWVALFYCSSSTAVLYFSGTVRRKREIETAKYVRMPAPVGGCEGLRVGDKRDVARIELHCGHRKRAENRSRRTLVT